MGLTPEREAELLEAVAKSRRGIERAERTVAERRQVFEQAVLEAHREGISERSIALVARVGRRAIYDIRHKHKES